MLVAKSPPAANQSAQPAVEYRRQARRLRCRLAHDPVGLQWALAGLARSADSPRKTAPESLHELRRIEKETDITTNSGARDFAAAVLTELDGPVLRYSSRQTLLRHAESIGIGRFDANLLIAAVQHRIGSQTPEIPEQKSTFFKMGAVIGLAALVQSAIALAAWWILFRP